MACDIVPRLQRARATYSDVTTGTGLVVHNSCAQLFVSTTGNKQRCATPHTRFCSVVYAGALSDINNTRYTVTRHVRQSAKV
jgi:hypothetical protein